MSTSSWHCQWSFRADMWDNCQNITRSPSPMKIHFPLKCWSLLIRNFSEELKENIFVAPPAPEKKKAVKCQIFNCTKEIYRWRLEMTVKNFHLPHDHKNTLYNSFKIYCNPIESWHLKRSESDRKCLVKNCAH